MEETSQFGTAVTEGDGRIRRFVEKPKGPPPSPTANTQICVFEPGIHGRIPEAQWHDFGFNVFGELVAKREPFFGFALPGYWWDIGTLDGYLDAQWDVMQGKVSATVRGEQRGPGLWVGQGCRISPLAEISAPAVVGAHCRIGSGARVGGATAIADGVHVPDGDWLWNCVLWEKAKVGPEARIREAVIGPAGVIAERGKAP